MKIKITLLCAVLFLGIASCKQTQSNEILEVPAIDLSKMDTTVNPAQDFFQYVNGTWLATTEIPSDQSRWGSFNELRKMNDSMTLALVDKAVNDKSIDAKTDEGKVVTFFKAAMDIEGRNKAGVSVIQPMLDKVATIQTKQDVINFMIEHEPVMGSLFGSGVFADLKNSSTNALYLGTGSLGLPERDYYLDNDADSKEKRVKYVEHVTKMLQFLGDSEADSRAQANRILAFETTLAEAMMSKEDSRDPTNIYHPKTVKELGEIAGTINWSNYFDGIGAKNFEQVIVMEPKYMARVNEVLSTGDISNIKEYLRWTVLNDAAGYLTEDLEAANFDFYSKTLRDVKEPKPLKERVLQSTNGVLGEALGKLYVKEYFPAEAKEVAKEMIANVKKAFSARIDNVDWMSDDTKTMAKKKLNAMRVKIGYPDKWKDYGELEVGDSYYQNILNARKWNFKEDIGKIGEDVDKDEWGMSPQTVNAYFNPLNNEIVFPAAILQLPFFNFKADAAVNYGGMGAVIGHEISHGFDDSGAKFDADGNLENWWTAEDEEEFNARGKQLIAQYDAYEPLPSVNVNGEFTLGENIGDLGGINVAYDALQLHLAEEENPGLIDGFTPEQRLFISWGTIWRTMMTDEEMKNRIKTDSHSPGMYRAVGPIMNVDGFHEAFNTQPGDKMYKAPEDRIKIW